MSLRDRQGAAKRQAVALRYAPEPPDDRGGLDLEYSDAMAGVAASYPDDHEAQVLYAESLMDLRPWDYWTEAGDPQPGIADALSSLQRVIDADERLVGIVTNIDLLGYLFAKAGPIQQSARRAEL